MYGDYINLITPFFREKDYNYSSKAQAFVKVKGISEDRFIVKNTYKNIQVSLGFAIKFKIIDGILAEIYNVKIPNTSNTIYIDLTNSFKEPEDAMFFVTSDKELQDGYRKTIFSFETYADPYFQKYSDLEGLYALINQRPIETSNIQTFTYHNNPDDIVLIGLIVATLLDKESKDQLEDRFIQFMKKNKKQDFFNEFMDHFKRYKEIDYDKYKMKYKL